MRLNPGGPFVFNPSSPLVFLESFLDSQQTSYTDIYGDWPSKRGYHFILMQYFRKTPPLNHHLPKRHQLPMGRPEMSALMWLTKVTAHHLCDLPQATSGHCCNLKGSMKGVTNLTCCPPAQGAQVPRAGLRLHNADQPSLLWARTSPDSPRFSGNQVNTGTIRCPPCPKQYFF